MNLQTQGSGDNDATAGNPDASPLMPHAHIAVIGGGPAGGTAAMLLARAGVMVALIDRSAPNAWKCGEGLPPHANPVLRTLGVWERFLADKHCASYSNRSAWGDLEATDRHFLYHPHGAGWHLERARFDAMLANAAADAGAMRWTGCRVVGAQPRTQGGWRLDLQVGTGGDHSIQADAVIDASGRTSWFARLKGVRRLAQDRLVGLTALMSPADAQAEQDACTFIEAVQGGWWYSALLSDGNMAVAYMTDADLLPADARTADGWDRLLSQTTHTASRLRPCHYQILTGPYIRSANSSRLQRVIGEGWLAVGDAAYGHDPLSSQGILAALQTGQWASQALIALLCGRRNALREYVERTEDDYRRYWSMRTGYYALERHWPDSLFWQRRTKAFAAANA